MSNIPNGLLYKTVVYKTGVAREWLDHNLAKEPSSPPQGMAATPQKRTFNDFVQDRRETSDSSRSRPQSPRMDGVPITNSAAAPDASIVLIGIPGTGKSSLAFLAASAYSRRVIEYEREFSNRTGQTLQEHRQCQPDQQGRQKRKEVLSLVLQTYSRHCIIVCDFSDLEYGANTLNVFGRHHPVIHVHRDLEGLRDHLPDWPTANVKRLIDDSARVIRRYSTHEFYNLSEEGHEPSAVLSVSAHVNETLGEVHSYDNEQSQSQSFLRLKRTERDFLKFLRLILGDHSRSPYQNSAYPLSSIPIEVRKHTYAAVISADEVVSGERDLAEFQIGADALLLQLPTVSATPDQDPHFKAAKAFAMLRRSTILPIIIDPGSIKSAGRTLEPIWDCARLAPEYILHHVKEQLVGTPPKLALMSQSKLIGYYRMFNQEDAIQTLPAVGDAKSYTALITLVDGDNDTALATLLQLQVAWGARKQTVPLSAYNNGMKGRFSQVANEGLLPVLGHGKATMGSSNILNAHALTAQQKTQALFAAFWYQPLHFCIVGANVEFSLSPAMHNEAYKVTGMPHKLLKRSTPSLAILDELATDESFGGAAITQPYKIAAVEKLSSLSDHARTIRAVNTVIPIRRSVRGANATDLDVLTTRNEGGKIVTLHGENTDWIGMRACLRRGLSPINAIRKTSSGLVLGAGGMARAAIYALIHMGVQNVFIYNRTLARAEQLAAYYNEWLRQRGSLNGESVTASEGRAEHVPTVNVLRSLTDEWPENYRHPTLIISSVPPETLDGVLKSTFTLPSNWLGSPSGGVVVELTYNPLVTALVEQIRSQAHRGWIIMTGLDMLPEQAFAQFELFTGRRAPRHVMQSEVLKAFREMKMRRGLDATGSAAFP